MKVDALWIVEPNKMEIRPVDIPDPGYDEVQIQIKACGVCAWDSYLYQGISNPKPIPYTFGHEGAGIVTKVGAGVKSFKPGDKVFAASGANDMMMQYHEICCVRWGWLRKHVTLSQMFDQCHHVCQCRRYGINLMVCGLHDVV